MKGEREMRKKRLLALAVALTMIFSGNIVAFATQAEETAATEQASESESTADGVAATTATGTAVEAGGEYDTSVEVHDQMDDLYELYTIYADKYVVVEEQYEEKGYKSVSEDTQIVLKPETATTSGGAVTVESLTANYVGKNTELTENAVLNTEENDYLEYKFNVEETGLYEIWMNYYTVDDTGAQMQRKFEIDGKVPFDEANTIPFYRYFQEERNENGEVEVEVNAVGNEVYPKHEEVHQWQEQAVIDKQGYMAEPLQFYLEAGEHTLKVSYVDQDMYIGNITLKGSKVYKTYEEVKAEYEAKGYKTASEVVSFEAEDAEYKNDSTLRRDSDNDPKCSPASASERLLNTIGGTRWAEGNRTISWTFDVKEAGLYTINMRAKQGYSEGTPSYRQIMIDGEIPFEEMKLYQFPYAAGWNAYTLEDSEGEDYQFYFEEGTHTITMTIKVGPIYEVIVKTTDLIQDLSDLYMKITKITGTDPDTNYEYNLYRSMPELMGEDGEFYALAKGFEECADIIEFLSNETTSMETNYRDIVASFYEFSEDPDLVTSNISTLTDAQTNLGDYILDMADQPLLIDYFEMRPLDAEKFEIETSGFFEKVWYTIQNFLSSFTKDYTAIGGDSTEGCEEVIDVWIARGSEWGEIMKDMIDEDFTPSTGIGVNLKIIPAGQLDAGNTSSLMLAVASGNAPDVALGVDYTSPVEFAFRDAVLDVSQFEGFDELKEQFHETMFVPYEYNGGIFGFPETMDFTVIFYRSDVLKSLGLEVPRTWDDLFQTTLPVLYENNMMFAFPVDSTAASNSPTSLRGMTMFLIQNGGSYYTEDGMYSNLDTPEAYQAFKQWTDLYISYGLDAETSFFTEFRSGSTPIGVGTFSTYMQLTEAAPELYGRWEIAPMLGTLEEDGTIDRSMGGISATSNMIMSQAEKEGHAEEAWEFLAWYMDYETQIKYGRELEATIGSDARWATANVEAFESLPWDENHLVIIKNQMRQANEQPIVLGGYFTTRHLVNAWNRVYMQNQPPRDALEEAVKEINKEIRNKHEEYGFVYED